MNTWTCRLAALLLLLGGLTLRAEDVVLFDFSRGFDVKQARCNGGATVTLERARDGQVLRLVTGHAADWPGFELAAPAGRWDLSACAYVAVTFRNAGTNDATLNCRVDNPNAERGVVNCVTSSLDLTPGASGTIRVGLERKVPDWIKVEMFGMRGYPWGMPVPWRKPGEGVIDAANVVNLVIFTAKPTADHVFEITSIRAGGAYRPPTEKLKDPAQFFPCIDEFGQYRHADWPGKTHAAADLAAAREREAADLQAKPGPAVWDKYGGWRAGPTLKATDHFYVAKHQGKWWLVDPDGKLFFSNGIDCVTPYEGATPLAGREHWFQGLPTRDSEFQDCYQPAHAVVHGHYQGQQPLCFDFTWANLRRKYGQDWATAFATVTHRRLRSWGVNTIANWSDPAIYLQHQTPYCVSIWFGGKLLEGSSGYWGKFRDVFDPSFAAEIRKYMSQQQDKTAKDPWCIGYFVDNEIAWGDDDTSLAVAALTSPAGQEAKKVFIADLQAKHGTIEKLNAAWGTAHASWEALTASTTPPDKAKADAELKAFQAKTCDTYFRTIRDAVKAVAPAKLYLGCRFAWANATAVAAATKYCDVVSYNLYRRSVADFKLPVAADVPLIIGEFHFGALDRGPLHTGLVPVADQAERAAAYQDYLRGALRHPQFVGCHWFKYMDEPTTGRFYDEENYQIGFVDTADTPYPETVEAARAIGESMYRYRLESK